MLLSFLIRQKLNIWHWVEIDFHIIFHFFFQRLKLKKLYNNFIKISTSTFSWIFFFLMWQKLNNSYFLKFQNIDHRFTSRSLRYCWNIHWTPWRNTVTKCCSRSRSCKSLLDWALCKWKVQNNAFGACWHKVNWHCHANFMLLKLNKLCFTF